MPLPPGLVAGRAFLKALEQSGNFLGRMQVGNAHLQEFDLRVPVTIDGRLVDLQKLQRLRVKYPHGQGIIRKQE